MEAVMSKDRVSDGVAVGGGVIVALLESEMVAVGGGVMVGVREKDFVGVISSEGVPRVEVHDGDRTVPDTERESVEVVSSVNDGVNLSDLDKVTTVDLDKVNHEELLDDTDIPVFDGVPADFDWVTSGVSLNVTSCVCEGVAGGVMVGDFVGTTVAENVHVRLMESVMDTSLERVTESETRSESDPDTTIDLVDVLPMLSDGDGTTELVKENVWLALPDLTNESDADGRTDRVEVTSLDWVRLVDGLGTGEFVARVGDRDRVIRNEFE